MPTAIPTSLHELIEAIADEARRHGAPPRTVVDEVLEHYAPSVAAYDELVREGAVHLADLYLARGRHK